MGLFLRVGQLDSDRINQQSVTRVLGRLKSRFSDAFQISELFVGQIKN
jgi:hypothetical protein